MGWLTHPTPEQSSLVIIVINTAAFAIGMYNAALSGLWVAITTVMVSFVFSMIYASEAMRGLRDGEEDVINKSCFISVWIVLATIILTIFYLLAF